MNNFLDKIRIVKRQEVEVRRRQVPLPELRARSRDLLPARDFKKALLRNGIALIAEIKKASPSAGRLLTKLDPAAIGRVYQAAGAAAISVLTEETHFGGCLEHLAIVKEAVDLPVLRKDFLLDEYQLYESRLAGADAVLLIAELLSCRELTALLRIGSRLGLSCLVEAHGPGELEKAISAGAGIIGVNNRNLQTLQVDLAASLRLLPLIPDDRIKVSESGIKTRSDVQLVSEAGARAILVGETILKSGDIHEKIRELLGKK